MSSRYFLDIEAGEVVRRSAIAASTGVASADKIIRTDGTGKISATFLPDLTANTESITAGFDIVAGSFVTIYNAGGARRVREAVAVDNTRVAMAFCANGALSGTQAEISFGGILLMDATGLSVADEGKLLYLSAATAGKATKTPPSADNNIVQIVARIIEVAAQARIQIQPVPNYIRLLPAA